ncbi:MAG: chromosome segregation SMC family protein [Candidatus Puniceispirillales bacterium]
MTGFKSFAEPAEITIDDGLTGIVGPNGCGKSNIVESLRWLMGESSAKSMRGSDLEDIVFSGTASRPSRNFAEVTLTLDNAEMDAPGPYNASPEIEISRRLERGKGSSFRINGKSVRSKDVQLLFADMATGARSSGIVSQGKVDALINAKPRDRRNLLEEAANISGLHQRRHEAELRLNTAENNLERLEDILIQLDEQKAALMKQARQAARYRSIADRIRKADAHLLLARITAAMARLDDAESQLREAERQVAAATETASKALRQRDRAAEALPPLRQAESEKAAERQRLTLARTELDNEEARARRAAEDIAARQQQIDTDITRENQLLTDAEKALEGLTTEAGQLAAEDAAEKPRLAEAASRLASARSEADAAEKALADAAARSRAAEREQENLSRRRQDLQHQRDSAETALAAIDLNALQEDARTIASRKAEAEKAVASIREEKAGLEAGLEARRQKQAETTSARAEAQENLARTRAEAEALASLLTPADAESENPISQAISIAPGYEDAVAAALGDALAAPIAEAGPRYWRDYGRSPIACPDGATPLADHVEAPAVLAAALSGVGLVDTAAEALSLQAKLTPGQMLTSREGGLWRWDGYVLMGEGEQAAARRLRQEARLRELEQQQDGIARKAADSITAAEAAAADVVATETTLNTLRQQEQEASQQLNAALRDDDRASAAISAASARAEELTGIKTACDESLAAVDAEIAGLADSTALHDAVIRLTSEAEEKRQALADAMGAEREITGARMMRQRRNNEIERETGLWQDRQKGAHQRIDELNQRRSNARAEAENLAGVPEMIRQKRDQLAETLEGVDAEQQAAADTLAAAETALQLAENTLRDADQALARERESLIRLESSRDMARQEQAAIVDRIRERLDASPDDLGSMAGLAADDAIDTSDEAIAVLEQRYERLIRERENVGPVNLRAEEEMQEVEERILGLEAERDDLIAAIGKLRTAINQLNREGRERLLKSFADVNRYFGAIFNSLFDGGTAEISLTEAEDPLEAGLEILASPPGKKLQSLSLLSGGEKALTAIALIFAVFLTNPSPICILDEVDAPLDDSNVARFCDILNQIADKTGTRFIIVTHHRLTMARMDRLYGVTMEQKGVSRIVSVDLQTAERFDKSA